MRLYEEKRPGYSPLKGASVSWDVSYFRLHEKFCPGLLGMNMSHGIVFSLVQFDLSYRSAIIILNSTFILGLSASRSNPIKAVCDL